MLRLEIKGIAELKAKLGTLKAKLEDFSPLWERYALIMSEHEAKWFASEGDGIWPELSPKTVDYKAEHGWNAAILSRSGLLEETLTDPLLAMSIDQGRSTIGTFTRSAMTWGTSANEIDEFPRLGLNGGRDREYAHYHQGNDPVTGEGMFLGSSVWGDDPPQRQVIPWPLPPEWMAEMDAADEDWVAEMLRDSGLRAA